MVKTRNLKAQHFRKGNSPYIDGGYFRNLNHYFFKVKRTKGDSMINADLIIVECVNFQSEVVGFFGQMR